MLYHGTCIAEAADALLAGDGLCGRRPDGRSKSPATRAGMVHLTPSFGLAATYAFNRGREDWPDDHGLTELRGHGWVFGFEKVPGGGAVPDEDELGHAARAALAFEAMGESPWSCMNLGFSQAVNADEGYRKMLLARMRATPAIAKRIDGIDPRRIKGPALVRLGLAVAEALRPDEIEWTLSLRPSVAVPPGPVATLAYRLEKLVFDPAGLDPVAIAARVPAP